VGPKKNFFAPQPLGLRSSYAPADFSWHAHYVGLAVEKLGAPYPFRFWRGKFLKKNCIGPPLDPPLGGRLELKIVFERTLPGDHACQLSSKSQFRMRRKCDIRISVMSKEKVYLLTYCEIYERNHLTHSSFAGYSYTLGVCGVGGGGLVDEERTTPRVHRCYHRLR
jgi:hypothetical protein